VYVCVYVCDYVCVCVVCGVCVGLHGNANALADMCIV